MSRKIERKALALFLMTALLFCMVVPATATGSPGLEETIAQVQARYPGAEITIGDDNSIHVVLPYSIDNAISPASADDLYAPEGGTYYGYRPPAGIISPEIPTYKTYIPSDMSQLFYEIKTEPTVFEEFIGALNDVSDTPGVVDLIATYFGVTVNYVTAGLFLTGQALGLLAWIDAYSLETAMDDGADGAISVQITTFEGYPMYIYSGWGGVYVNPDPYAMWNPTWHSEEWPF